MANVKPRLCNIGRSCLDRQAYCCLLRTIGFETAIESAFDPKSVWRALRQRPDLVIIDADGECGAAVECVEMILRLNRDVRVLVMSTGLDTSTVQAWCEVLIHGYVVKEGGVEELKAAVEAVARGDSYYSYGVRQLLEQSRAALRATSRRLSARESELLPLLARGLTLRDAAAEMSVSYKTADGHRTRLMRKLGVKSRVELARYAIRQHIIDA